MPSYTHLRRAQPVLAAHFFLAHAAALRRDHARLTALLDDADELPLGSGAIAGTSYAIDVHWLAEHLGFSRIVAQQHRRDRRSRHRGDVSLRCRRSPWCT